MTKGNSPSSLAKPRAASLITLAVLLFTFCLETLGVIAPFRLKTLDLLFRHVPLAKASPAVVVVTVDQPDAQRLKEELSALLPQGAQVSVVGAFAPLQEWPESDPA